MATNKPIVISMKMLADVKDADKLLDYVTKIEEQLKKAGGQSADGLLQKLSKIRNEISKSDKSATTTQGYADKVKAMMPGIAKAKALGSLETIDSKITGGGFQAESLKKTILDMRKAVDSGKMSREAIESMSSALESFIEKANELPPEGLKELSSYIVKVVTNTQELQSVIAELNGIEFDLGDLEGLQRIEAADKIKEIEAGLIDLESALKDIDPSNAEKLSQNISNLKEVLSQPIGSDSIKRLNDELKNLSKTADKLSGKDLAKVGDSIRSISSKSEELADTVSKTGNSLIDNLNPIEGIAEAAGLRVSGLTRTVIGLAAKIPLIGVAIKALPVGWILAIVGAIVAAVDMALDHMKELEKEDAENRFKNAEQTLEGISKEIERQNFLRDLAYKKERNIVSALREQQNAMSDLKKVQDDLNKAKESYGLTTSEETNQVSMKYDLVNAEREKEEALRNIAREKEDAAIETRKLKKELAAREKERDKFEKQARINQQNSMEAASKAGSLGQALKDKFGLSGEDYKARSEQYNDLAQRANAKREESVKRIIEIEQELKKQGNVKKVSDAKVAAVLAKFEQSQADIKEKSFNAERNRSLNINQRARDEELFLRGRQDEERSYARGRNEPWQSLDAKLKTAQEEYKRLLDLEDKAYKERERVLKAFSNRKLANGQSATEMTTEEQTAFSNATQDLASFRSARFSEQTNIDQLKKQIYDRKVDETYTKYQYRKEDTEWGRSGAYERSSWAGKLRMDIERYREGKRMFEDAQSQIEADNNGTATLTPEQRRLVERARNEGRDKMTSTRDSIRSAAMSGDASGTDFIRSLLGHQNRLTRMGLGGDVGNWDRQTASNTRKLVQQNKELLKAVNRQTGSEFGWGM